MDSTISQLVGLVRLAACHPCGDPYGALRTQQDILALKHREHLSLSRLEADEFLQQLGLEPG